MKQKIILAAAVLIGLLAAFLTGSYIASQKRALAEHKAKYDKMNREVQVVVPLKSLPAGTKLTEENLRFDSFPKRALRDQAIYNEDGIGLQLIGRRLAMSVAAGQPLLWSDIEGGAPESQALSSKLKRKMRALSISVSSASSVSNMVRPDDKVDVLGTFALPSKTVEGATELVTMTVLQDVQVLAVGQETAATYRGGRLSYSQVTLQVTPHEAEVLTFAEQMRGRLTLSLRNPEDDSYEKTLPQVDFAQIRQSLESMNENRQKDLLHKR